jgi:hypothetical protein
MFKYFTIQRLILVFVFCGFFSTQSKAQSLEWAKSMGSSNYSAGVPLLLMQRVLFKPQVVLWA